MLLLLRLLLLRHVMGRALMGFRLDGDVESGGNDIDQITILVKKNSAGW